MINSLKKINQKNKPKKIRFFLVGLAFALLAYSIFFYFSRPPLEEQTKITPDEFNYWLTSLTRDKSFKATKPVAQNLINLGSHLFFDKRLSANGQISCASCHQPTYFFTDRNRVGIGMAEGNRRTPTLLDVAEQSWFFWDGRATTLEAQALGPLENPAEHNFSRLAFAQALFLFYEQDLRQFLSAQEWMLLAKLFAGKKIPWQGLPPVKVVIPNVTILAYTLASLDSFILKDHFILKAQQLKTTPVWALWREIVAKDNFESEWNKNWESLSKDEQTIVLKTTGFGLGAIASFETTLVSANNEFDNFVQKIFAEKMSMEKIENTLSKNFTKNALKGFEIFIGKGKCTFCHRGHNLTDGQFHNIGFSFYKETQNKGQVKLDLGRSMGILQATQSEFECDSAFRLPGNKNPQSCEDLKWLDKNQLSFVGAFKTPSLRNVKNRGPYMHDGRLDTLEEVIEHYNTPPPKAVFGHREETVTDLHLSSEEKSNLLEFLKTL